MRGVALAFIACLALATSVARAENTTQHWTIGAYNVVLRAARNEDGPSATLTVARGGAVVGRVIDQRLWVNPAGFFAAPGSADPYSHVPHAVGGDVLGLGAPTLVVETYSGGAHCCFALSILVLGDAFRALPTIKLFDAEDVRITRVASRKRLVLSFSDFTFAYWYASFAESSAPRVTLAYDEAAGRYVADGGLMRAALPSEVERAALRSKANAAHKDEIAGGFPTVPQEVTQPVLDFIYTGHLADARDFLDAAWAGTREAREDYWSELTTCELRLSPYWPTVLR